MGDMECRELFHLVGIDPEKVDFIPQVSGNLDVHFDIDPDTFLEFAQLDIEGNDDRAMVNALSNAKRAIDCQADKILYCLGIKAKRTNFPSKAQLLSELGIVSPSIIRKVIAKRNYLEHEYRLPQREEVEDAIDIAMLFVESSNRVLDYFPDSFYLQNGEEAEGAMALDSSYVSVSFDDETKVFRFYGDREGKQIGNTTVRATDSEYHAASKIAIAVRNRRKLKEAVRSLYGSETAQIHLPKPTANAASGADEDERKDKQKEDGYYHTSC